MRNLAKGALWLLFLYTFTHSSVAFSQGGSEIQAVRVADQLNLGVSPEWKALLHYAQGRCFIQDRGFYLNPDECSPERELESLIRAAFSSNPELVADVSCRFPARLAFISSSLNANGIQVPNVPCQELLDYERRAPAGKIALAFASENITHPLSMMGHVFLRFEGRGSTGETYNHAISFYTSLRSMNVPALVADSLFLGMPSYFSLMPYSQQIAGYRELEKRSVWEYWLNLSELQRRLIHLHVWELKPLNAPYFFVGYNCATVVYFIIAVAAPSLLDDMGVWVSPLDVVRRTNESGLVESRTFRPSIDWQIRALSAELGPKESSRTATVLETGTTGDIASLGDGDNGDLRLAFASELVEQEVRRPRLLAPGRSEFAEKTLENALSSRRPVELSAENIKDPLKGPKAGQFSLGAAHLDGIGYSKVGIQPASHTLFDDNRQSWSESALELGSLSLLYNPEEGRPIVEKLHLYSFESLVPYNLYTGGMSSRISIGIDRQRDSSLSSFAAGSVNGGIGQTIMLSEDARAYAMINGGVNYGDGLGYVSIYPEVGGVLYEVLNMKSVASYKLVCGEHQETSCYQEISVTQSLFAVDGFSIYAQFDETWDGDAHNQFYEIGIKHYF